MVDIAAGSAVSIEKYPRPRRRGDLKTGARPPGGPGSRGGGAARVHGGRGCQHGSGRPKRRSESIE
jgi:hypothetical protein